MNRIPQPIRADFARAKRLEWWTLAWMGSVIVVMFSAVGSSQAMRTALIEDVLSLIPAIVFLIAARFEYRDPTPKYPFGFVRVNSLAFLVAAVALCAVGGFMLIENTVALLRAERPEIGTVVMFGKQVWFGWLMIAALAYSAVVPMVLGHLKMPVAVTLRDKVLHTDALMQKADWMTGLAGIAGVTGIWFGLWWADATAALFIAFSVLKDGVRSMATAAAELLDGAPRELEGQAISDEAQRLVERLRVLWPEGDVRLRESGRYIIATVEGVHAPANPPSLAELMGDDPVWRLARLSFSPPGALRDDVG